MARAWAWAFLLLLAAMIATQLSTKNAHRHWLRVGIQTAALLACLAAIL
ncbi:MAG TPA: hypothetical protein VK797_07445 [Tepidisphaeraceae bacterium]|jgi:hypothetical protein|nr:hypothetical protein [Tepidisphaeraceae bacterium]